MFRKVMLFANVVGFVSLTVVAFADPPEEGGNCNQACHNDQYWKKDGSCIKADVPTCCDDAWAVATGGTLTNIGDDVDHWKYEGTACSAYCADKSDSVASPFQTIGLTPSGKFGSFPECRCQ